MGDRFWHLKSCRIFEQLAPDEVERLESRARSRSVPRGELIYVPTDAGDSVLLVTAGRVRIYHLTGDGKQAVLSFVDPGELFGELALFDGSRRDEFAEAMEPSTVLLLPAAALQDVMEQRPQFTLGVTRMIGLRRQRIERRLKSLLFRSNRERLVHLLVELAEKYGTPSPEGVALGIRLSQQDLASVIGSTRETVTVLLGELQSEGALIVRRKQLILRNLPALATSIGLETPPLPPPESPPRLLRQAQCEP